MRMEVVQELTGRVMKISVEEETDDFGREMLAYQSVKGILGAQIQWVNCAPQYLYEIGNRLSLSELFYKENLTAGRLRRLVSQLVHIIERAEEYFLNERNLLLLTDYMFCDERTGELFVAYLDGYDTDVSQGISKMLEQFMNTMNHRDKELVFLVYGLHKISRERNFCLSQLTELTGERESETAGGQEKRVTERENEVQTNFSDTMVRQTIVQEQDKGLKQKKKKISETIRIAGFFAVLTVILLLVFRSGVLQDMSTGGLSMKKLAVMIVVLTLLVWCVLNHRKEKEEKEDGTALREEDETTAVLADEVLDETVVLDKSLGQTPYVNLIPDDWQREEIHIRKSPVFIGKDASKSDVCIKEGEISRVHAKMVLDEEQVCVIDQESTNGTYVNGKRLVPWERRQIKNDDKIAFSSIYYRVEMDS